ncbi:hypothetical protein FACS1894161_0880 [Spirochaetia bacterium]|nr:hypothetical protein FACS1894161_0880 [Spirochaetia bacterium]
MWSKELQELSRTYLEYDGTHVKSTKGKFGILGIDFEKDVLVIKIKPELTEILTFKTVDEIINAGWAVD